MLRRLGTRLVPLLALAVVGCSSSSPGTTTGTGGSTGSGGAPGSGGAGSGGVAPGTGGASEGSGGAPGSGGNSPVDAPQDLPAGSGGMVVTMGPACATSPTPADGNDPANGVIGITTAFTKDVVVRQIVSMPTGDMTKIDYDPMSKSLVMINSGGSMWKVDPVAKTATRTEMNYGGGGASHRGLAFASDGTLYVLSTGTGQIAVTIRKGVGAPNARTWTTVATSASYPAPDRGSNFNHAFSGLAVSPDGQYLYFSSGARTDHGETETGMREVPLSSAIFRVPTNGNNVNLSNNEAMLKAGGYLYADGTRNTFDLSFNAEGDLIGGDNGPDVDLPDEVNWIQEGKHYGFPWRFGSEPNPVIEAGYSPNGDMRLHTGYQAVDIGSYAYDATFPAAPAGVTFTDPILNRGPDGDAYRMGRNGGVMKASANGGTLMGISAHRSPLGLSFDTKGQLCGKYFKAGFMVSYGAVQAVMGANERGEDLLLLQLKKMGTSYEMNVTQVARGIRAPMDSVLVGNKLYTISYGTGSGHAVYEFTLPTP